MKKLNDYAYGLIQAKIAELEVANYCREQKLEHVNDLIQMNMENRSRDKRQEAEISRLLDAQADLEHAQDEIQSKIDKYNEILEESDKL